MKQPRGQRAAMATSPTLAQQPAIAKRSIAALAIALLIAATSHAQSDDAAAIKALNTAWIHAYKTKDTAIVSRIWADDMILINPAGKKMTKPEMLHAFGTTPDFQSAEVDTADVRLIGNVGLITAHITFTSLSTAK